MESWDNAGQLKRTQRYGKWLERYDKKLAVIEQGIYDLGIEYENDFPESKHGGLIYQKVMDLDVKMEELRAHLQGIVQHCADLAIEDC